MKQRTPEWHAARLGLFTSSKLGVLMSTGRREKFGKTAMSYIYQVAAERAIIQPFKEGEGLSEYLERVDIGGKQVRWGNDMEALARKEYENKTGIYVIEIGFMTHMGCFGDSPDGIAIDGLKRIALEIKCPTPAVHRMNCQMKTGDDLKKLHFDYYLQCQGHIMANMTCRCDFISFDPMQQKSMHIIEVYPDKELIEQIRERVKEADEIVKQINSDLECI